jgi:hypothetical protein
VKNVSDLYSHVQNHPTVLGDPSGLLSVGVLKHKIRHCGGVDVTWYFGLHGYEEGDLVAVQHICTHGGDYTRCEEEKDGCGEKYCKADKGRKCPDLCLYEYFLIKKFLGVYHLPNDFNETNPYSSAGCKSRGKTTNYADMRVFRLTEAVFSEIVLKFNTTAHNFPRDNPKGCPGATYTTESGFSLEYPTFFDDDLVLVDRGLRTWEISWKCCGETPNTQDVTFTFDNGKGGMSTKQDTWKQLESDS